MTSAFCVFIFYMKSVQQLPPVFTESQLHLWLLTPLVPTHGLPLGQDVGGLGPAGLQGLSLL
jgi:hypothetical protein